MELFKPIYILQKNRSISWDIISRNPNALLILEQYKDKISYHYLCKNTNDDAVKLLLTKPLEYIDWFFLSSNSTNSALDILEANMNNIHWKYLSENTNNRAIDLLEKNIDKINWTFFSKNNNPRAIKILQKYYDKINWKWLSINNADEAIELLYRNTDKIFWTWFSYNDNPRAIKMIEKNLDKVNSYWLSRNPNAIHILKTNKEKINWEGILLNKSKDAIPLIEEYLEKYTSQLFNNYNYFQYIYYIGTNPYALHLLFTYDYEKMMDKNKLFTEELVKYVFYPIRLLKICNTYRLDLLEYIEIIS